MISSKCSHDSEKERIPQAKAVGMEARRRCRIGSILLSAALISHTSNSREPNEEAAELCTHRPEDEAT